MRTWTKEEEKFILDNFDKLGVEKCATRLGRPIRGIYYKRSMLIKRGETKSFYTVKKNGKCVSCGKEMWYKNRLKSFCNRKCRYTYSKGYGRILSKKKLFVRKKCERCKKDFYSYKQLNKYCGTDCYKKSNAKIEVICRNCGKKIFRGFNYIKKHKTLCCSLKCSSEFRRWGLRVNKKCLCCGKDIICKIPSKKFCGRRCGFIYRKETGHTMKGKQTLKNCLICGERFWCNKSQLKHNFCSQKCSRIEHSRILKKRANENYNKVEIECKRCGKLFYDLPINYRKYCSRECWNKRKEDRLN